MSGSTLFYRHNYRGISKALLSDLLAVMFDTYGKTVKICRAMLGSGIEIRLNVEENRWNY